VIKKYASSATGTVVPHGSLAKWAHRHNFEYTPRPGYLYIRSRAISSRTNDNFDTFPAEELRQAWGTFIGKPVFVNHHNEDHRRMRGVIIDAALHDDLAPDGTDDAWIEVLMEIDALNFPLLAAALIKHDIERTSMGTDVIESECSFCGNVARTPEKYCAHVRRMKGQRLRRVASDGTVEDVLVHEVCRGLSFFENSLLVEEPADPTAFTFGLDTRGVEGIINEGSLRTTSSKTAAVELNEIQRARFKGTTVDKDKEGFYCRTHRCRSDSYPSIDEIPDSAIEFIESTGKKNAAKDRDHGNTDKGNTTDRGYGWDHQKKREELLSDNPKCHWCKKAPATEADHYNNGLVPSCSGCNNDRSHDQQKAATITSEERKAYNTGWAAGLRGSYDAFGRADQRGAPRAWYIGFMDADAGVEKYSGLAELEAHRLTYGSRTAKTGTEVYGPYPPTDRPGPSRYSKNWIVRFRSNDVIVPFLFRNEEDAVAFANEVRSGKHPSQVDQSKALISSKTAGLPEGVPFTHSNSSESYEDFGCPNCGSPYFGQTGFGPRECGDCGTKYVLSGESKTAGNLDTGPTEPGRDAIGIRWEGVATEGSGYTVDVLWPGDEAPLVSAIVATWERANEWAAMAYGVGAVRVGITDNVVRKWYSVDRTSRTAASDLGVPGEARAPHMVQTLRPQNCPVCESDAVWNSDGRCDVCGYLPAPKPFRAPDTDVAGRADQSGGWFDPELTRATPFTLGSNPVNSRTSTRKGQRPPEGEPTMANSVAAQARQRMMADQRLARENGLLRQQVARLTRQADIDNPAQPVAEPAPGAAVTTTEQLIAQPTKADVGTPGGVIPDPISAPGNVQTPGGEIADPIGNTIDVEVPVAGTTEPDPNAVIGVVPDASGESFGEPAYQGDWINPGANTVPNIGGNAATAASQRAVIARITNSVRDRIWASMHLARLRTEAGIADGDQLEVARRIEGSAISMEAIQAETSALRQVASRRPRGPLPRQASVQQRTPSLAGGVPVIGSLGQRQDDEALFE